MKIVQPIILSVAMLFLGNSLFAQTGVPVPVEGFNHDLVANGNSDVKSSVTNGFDFEKDSRLAMVFYQKGYKTGKYGLPSDGKIKSKSTPNVSYQLADYSQKNATLISVNGDKSTLRLKSPGSFDKITLLAASAGDLSQDSSFRAELNFSDGSKASAEFKVPDWFKTNKSIAIAGVDRVAVSSGRFHNTSTDPKLFDCAIDLQAEDELKVLNTVTITKTQGKNRVSIFALCGVTAEGTPQAVKVKKPEKVSETDAQLSWTKAKDAKSYKLDVSKTPDFEMLVGEYNNLDVGDRTDLPIRGLRKATKYYFRVRPSNDNGSGANSDVVAFSTGGEAETEDPIITYVVNGGERFADTNVKIFESRYCEFETGKGNKVVEGAAILSGEQIEEFHEVFLRQGFRRLRNEYLEGEGPKFSLSYKGKKVTFHENPIPQNLRNIFDHFNGMF